MGLGDTGTARNAFRFGMPGIDLANGSDGNARFMFFIPAGLKVFGFGRVYFYWTSTVTGGNVVFDYDTRMHHVGTVDGLFNNTPNTSLTNVVAANGVANGLIRTQAQPIDLFPNVAPYARHGTMLSVEITRKGAHASDTNTGTVFIGACELWLGKP